MALARYSFLPWLRRGIVNEINAPQPNASRAKLDVVLNVVAKAKKGAASTGTATVTQTMSLIGPGDVIGINKSMVVRTEPRHNISDFEPNYLAFIEFYDEDFPWRYTPAPPSANHRLQPWLALMVLKKSEFQRVNAPGRPLAGIKLNAPAEPIMPLQNQTWAFAHVHINQRINANDLNDHSFSESDRNSLDNLLKNNPDKGISRLVSPRRLEPKTGYIAFLVPAFEVGRKAGLGIDVAPDEPGLASSWADGQLEFPVYFEWSFSTSQLGDFETLVRRLQPKTMDPRVGIRYMDVQEPGFGVNGIKTQFSDQISPSQEVIHPEGVVGLEGALKAPGTREVPPDYLNEAGRFDKKVAAVINDGIEEADMGGDPVIVPPLYGQWHALAKKLGVEAGDSGWVNDLNKDPRFRAISGIGTKVVQDNQEPLMRKAWQQVGDVLAVNSLIRHTQASMWVTQMMFDKNLKTMMPARTLQVTFPVHNRVKGSPVTIKFLTRNSRLPQAVLSGNFRKILRPRSLTAKRFIPEENKNGAVADIIQDLNDGKLSAAPPLDLPKETPSLDILDDGLNPTPPEQPEPPTEQPTDPVSTKVPNWILLLLALILLGLIYFFNEYWIPIAGLLLVVLAFVDFRKFFKKTDDIDEQPTDPGDVPTDGGGDTEPPADNEILPTDGGLNDDDIGLPDFKPGNIGEGETTEPKEVPVDPPGRDLTDDEKEKIGHLFDPEILEDGKPVVIVPPEDFELKPPIGTGETAPPDVPNDSSVPPTGKEDFKTALDDLKEELGGTIPEIPERQPLDIDNAVIKIKAAVDPKNAFPKRLRPKVNIIGFDYFHFILKYNDWRKFGQPTIPQPGILLDLERIVEVMAYPHFKQPMYEALRDLSPDLFVPNLNLIPQNSISLMVTNQRFIESYMVGLNHEMSRELLWREYPTDQRGSYFRQFWDASTVPNREALPQKEFEESLKDIPEIHRWGRRTELGDHNHREADGDEEQLVLTIRGDLLKRYPNTIIYAMKAKMGDDGKLVLNDESGQNLSISTPTVKFPIYKAEVKPDITFLGFDLTIEEAKGDLDAEDYGWFFIIKEVPGEPRFGLDEEAPTTPEGEKWDNLSWEGFGDLTALRMNQNPPANLNGLDNPSGVNWNTNSADLAFILYQKPVMIAVHAGEMLKNL
ncbi:MAG TPA: hypothetical protein ENJ95_21270 [Bacteroidetes bacterium]|nr:hypothetical protein [Bacteroidota bacterium]